MNGTSIKEMQAYPGPFDRPFLARITALSFEMSQQVENPLWKSACLDLANAADRLDSMIARSTATETPAPYDPTAQAATPDTTPQ